VFTDEQVILLVLCRRYGGCRYVTWDIFPWAASSLPAVAACQCWKPTHGWIPNTPPVVPRTALYHSYRFGAYR